MCIYSCAIIRADFLAVLMAACTASAAVADDWPGWLGPQRDGIWREEGILDHFPPGGPKVRWRVPTGSGYSGPAVVGNRVYLMDYTPKAPTKSSMNMAQGACPASSEFFAWTMPPAPWFGSTNTTARTQFLFPLARGPRH